MYITFPKRKTRNIIWPSRYLKDVICCGFVILRRSLPAVIFKNVRLEVIEMNKYISDVDFVSHWVPVGLNLSFIVTLSHLSVSYGILLRER